MAINTPRDRLITMEDTELAKLLTAGYIDYGELRSINYARSWYENVFAKERLGKVRYSHKKLIIICGLSRKGKSAAADAIFNKYDKMYQKVGEFNDRWFNGWRPNFHDSILLQEMNVTKETTRFLLRLADYYPLTGEIKGDTVFMNPKFVIATA